MVVVTDSTTSRQHQLHEIEWSVAQQMDGTRTVDDLFTFAKTKFSGATRAQIEQFVVHLANAGLLAPTSVFGGGEEEDQFADATAVDGGQRSWVVAEVHESADSSLPLQETEIETDADELAPNVVKFRRPIGKVASDPTVQRIENPDSSQESTESGARTVVDPSNIAANIFDESSIPSERALAPYRPPELAPIEPIEEEPSISEHGEIIPVPPAEEVESGLGAPELEPEIPTASGEERPPWYLRSSFRRARIPVALLLFTGILAVVPYPRYVTEECSVLPATRAAIRAQLDGILSSIKVDEGQQVKAGEVLAELDARDIDAALQQARADVQSLAAKLEKMTAGSRPEEIARAEAAVAARAREVNYARIELERKQRLFTQGVGSGEQRDNARRDFEVKRSELSQAQAELRLMRAGFRSEEIKVAEAELRRAEAQVTYLAKKREQLTITTPIDGQVTTPKFRERLHARVAAGDTVCEVANTTQVRVEILVPEQEIDLVVIGQPTVVKVRSLPLQPFTGEVTFIAPSVDRNGDRRLVRVVTVLENKEGLLQEGMTGYAEINTGDSTLLRLAVRKVIRWVRVRFLI